MPTAGKVGKTPQPKRTLTRIEAVRAAEAKITRRNSLRKQRDFANRFPDPDLAEMTVRAPSSDVRPFRPRSTFSSDVWKAVRAHPLSRNDLQARHKCSARDRQAKYSFDNLFEFRPSRKDKVLPRIVPQNGVDRF